MHRVLGVIAFFFLSMQENENILLSASGDGSIKVWDVNAPPHANPLRSFEEHRHEAYCLNWNQVRRDTFLSGSWDDTIKLWSLAQPHSIRTFTEHSYCVYAAQWYAMGTPDYCV